MITPGWGRWKVFAGIRPRVAHGGKTVGSLVSTERKTQSKPIDSWNLISLIQLTWTNRLGFGTLREKYFNFHKQTLCDQAQTAIHALFPRDSFTISSLFFMGNDKWKGKFSKMQAFVGISINWVETRKKGPIRYICNFIWLILGHQPYRGLSPTFCCYPNIQTNVYSQGFGNLREKYFKFPQADFVR